MNPATEYPGATYVSPMPQYPSSLIDSVTLRFVDNESGTGITCTDFMKFTSQCNFNLLYDMPTNIYIIEDIPEDYYEEYADYGRGVLPMSEYKEGGSTGRFNGHGEIGVYSHIERMKITCNKDFGSEYPAGSDLAPIAHLTFTSVKNYVLNHFQGQAQETVRVLASDESAWKNLHIFSDNATLEFARNPNIKHGETATLTFTMDIRDYLLPAVSGAPGEKYYYSRHKDTKTFVAKLQITHK